MNILLVNPNVLTPPVFPVGLEYTAEHLIAQGRHTISVFDMNLSDRVEEAVAGQDLILVAVRNLDSGMGCKDFELAKTRDIITNIRKFYPGEIGIAGSGVNLSPDAVRAYLSVEYALASKGFGAVDTLLERLESGIRQPGVIRDFSSCIRGTFKRNILDKSFYLQNNGRIGVATKFGCPFRCQYCDYPAIDGRVVIKRPPEEVVEEIGYLFEAGVQRIFFSDAQFNIPVKHSIAILQMMLDKGLEAMDWDGFINPHKAAFTKELALLFRAFGKTRIHFGVDSLSDRMLHDLRKGFTVADVRNVVDLCKNLGMEVSCSLLFGHPTETVETVTETFKNVDEIGFSSVDIGARVRIYPETPLLEIALQNGVVAEGDPLLQPVFYPVVDEVTETLAWLAEQRPECHATGLVSLGNR
jgi:hypothetical protein